MPEIVSNVIDVYVFRRRSDEIEFLLLKRCPESRIACTWQAVHGGIAPGEKAWQAGVRELREETGLSPVRLWQLEFVNTFYMAREDVIAMCPCFAAEVTPDAPVALSEEHTEFRWLGVEAAVAEFLWPGQRRAVREVMELLVTPGAAEPFLRIPAQQ